MSEGAAPVNPLVALATKAGPEESLRSYKLLEALRGGDPAVILPLLPSTDAAAPGAGAGSGPVRRGSTPAVSETGQLVVDPQSSGTSTPLHLAVRCAKYPTVELVLKHCRSSLNSQDSKGQTPLHIAAQLNRTDVVALFLNEPLIDDMVRDVNGKTCAEVAGGSDVAGLISVSRANYNQSYLLLLATYVASPTSESTTTSAHASRLSVNLTSPKIPQSPQPSISTTSTNAPPTTNPTSPKVVSAASGHVSNTAAEKLYHFIQRPRSRCIDFSSKDGTSGTTLLHEAVRRKDLGLVKLVIAKGGDVLARDRKGKLPVDLAKDDRVKSVLRQGKLCFLAANSEGKALKAAASDGSVAPTAGDPPVMKGYLSKWTNVARGYRSRWFVLEKGVLSYYRSQEDEGKASRGSINMSVAKIIPPGQDGLKFEVNNKLGKSFPAFWLKGNHPVEVMRWVETLRQNIEHARDNNSAVSRTESRNSISGNSILEERGRRASTYMAPPNETPAGSSPAASFNERDGSIIGDDETFNGDEEPVPRAEDFHLLANGTKAQLELTQQLLDSLVVEPKEEVATLTPSANKSRPASIHSTSGRQADVKDALKGSLASLGQMLDEYVEVVGMREKHWIRKYEREIDAKRLWEENMKEVAAQHAVVEAELEKVGRDNTRRKRALQEVRATLATSPSMSPMPSAVDPVTEGGDHLHLPEDGDAALPPPLGGSPSITGIKEIESRARRLTAGTSGSLSPSRASRLRSGTVHTLRPHELEQIVDSALAGEGDDESEDDEDEFFEAIEAGQVLVTSEPTSPAAHAAPVKQLYDSMDLTPYKGYEHLRNKLPINNDNRPPVSLWAILKGSIGKDLTKISFPVFFNEPTSMLQRMAEDVEFSECLDSAAADPDPTKRIAFVAAFAMSNYSSTIGRIAKPFNPMLGETFEYVDLEKKYRYISEQVCHHPPISACIAQSPAWEYYGEVDAKSKFLGKSFEIRPTGVAHVKLRLPKAWAPNNPAATSRFPDMVTEHYSWTKVTTSVSNFLFGNPIIDHFGDMVVTNHQTGEKCTLTFKPRGWRGSGACEIKGKVVDGTGKEAWDIAGKWSSQLVARRVGAGTGDLAPDASLPTTGTGAIASEYISLWKNSVKPPGMPFNLTPYAITLNDDNPDLRKWLPPTDCRLRPDQHAFESGEFERANNLKTDLEEHQRATRRRREKGELPEHKPRWFSRQRDPDTGESYWKPAEDAEGQIEYWTERTRVGKAKEAGEKTATWDGVDPIFADF